MTELLVLMGSGETTPTMIKPHRAIFERVGDAPAVLLDTPYGFQSNADDISARAIAYFKASVGRTISAASWRRSDIAPVQAELALAELRAAEWIFTGPGSPTYALTHWRDTPLPQLFTRAKVLVFASAAALTLGSHTVPVYEIYKAGLDPYWATGLDLFAQLTGVPAVIIPHYDNAEGGHHDTRYCYLGEERLALMERRLPAETMIIGVDEHTAALVDLVTRTVQVVGNGALTLRHAGVSRVFPAGSELSISDLAAATVDLMPPPVVLWAPAPAARAGGPTLADVAEEHDRHFGEALAAEDSSGCVEAILALESAIEDWSADTQVGSDRESARALLRGMIVRFGEFTAASRQALPSLVETINVLRAKARANRDFGTADALRDALTAAGLEVRDIKL